MGDLSGEATSKRFRATQEALRNLAIVVRYIDHKAIEICLLCSRGWQMGSPEIHTDECLLDGVPAVSGEAARG